METKETRSLKFVVSEARSRWEVLKEWHQRFVETHPVVRNLIIFILPALIFIQVGGRLGNWMGMGMINLATSADGRGYLSFPLEFHDLVTLEGVIFGSKISSTENFVLMGEEKAYVPEFFPVDPLPTLDDSGGKFVILETVTPGTYRYVPYGLAPVHFEFWGYGYLRATSSRSDENMKFGLDTVMGVKIFMEIIALFFTLCFSVFWWVKASGRG